MARTDIGTDEKNKIAKELMVKEAKRIADAKGAEKVEAYVDQVQLGVDGYKMRYYSQKFLVRDPADLPEFTNKIKQAYIEGL